LSELSFVTDMVEEQIVKGNLRWLANFSEISRDYQIGDVSFPIYALGGLQERGFFLSKIYSAMVTPKYKVHLFLYTTQGMTPKLLRKLIVSCKSKFGGDDWILLGLVQSQPFEKTAKDAILEITDRTVGVAAFSLVSKETLTSNNVLGKGLSKQLKLTEAKFEAFDVPNFLKSFTIVLGLGVLILVMIALSGFRAAIQPLTLLLLIGFSLIAGQRIYKSRYHTSLTMTSKGFRIKEGGKVTEDKWSHYGDVTLYITPNRETLLRLHSKEDTFDVPLSRVGVSRKEAFDAVQLLIKKKQEVTQ